MQLCRKRSHSENFPPNNPPLKKATIIPYYFSTQEYAISYEWDLKSRF